MDVNQRALLARDEEAFTVLNEIINMFVGFMTIVSVFFHHRHRTLDNGEFTPNAIRYSLIRRIPKQIEYIRLVTGVSDEECITQLRMNRAVFSQLCHMLENSGGLKASRNSSIAEQVAVFLSILAHHTKNRIARSNVTRSTRTISKHFHRVLNAIIRLHPLLLVRPEPIDDQCTTSRWKCFKNCLGALDGSYINVTVPRADQPRYRNRKGHVSVNVLAVCDINMNFVYVLTGWEGSANDSRVLRDAVTKTPGFRVPRGSYYLCDGGYPNGEGFLAPYRGVRYHLNEWGAGTSVPRNKEEFFNMKHSRARNVIERAFGVLKKRWAILRSASFYPIRVQNRIILSCCLLHNFIRSHMLIDPIDIELPNDTINEDADDFVDTIGSTQQSNAWRDALATSMYNEWRGNAS